jgi:hypothetical protein
MLRCLLSALKPSFSLGMSCGGAPVPPGLALPWRSAAAEPCAFASLLDASGSEIREVMLGTWLAVTGVAEFALGALCIGVAAAGAAAAPPSAELGVGGRTLGSAGGPGAEAVRRGSIWKLFRGSEEDSTGAGGGAVEYELCEYDCVIGGGGMLW